MNKIGLIFLLLVCFIISIFIISNIKNITSIGVVNEGKELRRDTPLAVDDDYLYSLTKDNFIIKYDKHNNFKQDSKRYSEIDNSVSNNVRSFAVDDKYLYAISWNGNIYIYNKTSLDSCTLIPGNSSRVMAIYVTHDQIYTGSWDCSLKIWAKTDFSLIDTFFLKESYDKLNPEECCKVHSIAVDDDKIYVGCENAYSLVVNRDNKKIYKIKAVDNTFKKDDILLIVGSINFDDSYIYFTYDRFLKILNKKNLSLAKEISFSDPLHLIQTEKDEIAVGGRDGFFLLAKSDFTPVKISIPQQEWGIHSIVSDENNIYLGSPQNNILIIDRNSKKFNTLFEIV